MEEIYRKIFVGMIVSKIDEEIEEITKKEKEKLEILGIEPKDLYRGILQAMKEACELLDRSMSIMEMEKSKK